MKHMHDFGLINIASSDFSENGRLYSLSRINFGKPEIARMLSPDNYVQASDFTQNFNRYSYCLNNPLKYTDPTGNNYVSDMYHGNNGGGDYFTGWGNYNLSRHLGNHLNGFANSGDQGMFAGANSRANFYFGWAIPYYKGETKTSFSEYYSNGGKISSVTVDGPITVQFPGENGGTYTIGGEASSSGGVNVYIETDGIGHVYAEVNGTVFSYGRYDGSLSPSSARYGPVGHGIMMRYKGREAQNFIKKRTEKYPTSVYNITDVNAKAAYNYWNNMYWSGDPSPSGGRHVDTYILLGVGNNCATMIGNGLRKGGFFMNNAHTPWEMESQFQWYNSLGQ